MVKCVYFNWLTDSGVDKVSDQKARVQLILDKIFPSKICELITSRPMDGSMQACIVVADDWIYWKGKIGTATHQCYFVSRTEL